LEIFVLKCITSGYTVNVLDLTGNYEVILCLIVHAEKKFPMKNGKSIF